MKVRNKNATLALFTSFWCLSCQFSATPVGRCLVKVNNKGTRTRQVVTVLEFLQLTFNKYRIFIDTYYSAWFLRKKRYQKTDVAAFFKVCIN